MALRDGAGCGTKKKRHGLSCCSCSGDLEVGVRSGQGRGVVWRVGRLRPMMWGCMLRGASAVGHLAGGNRVERI
eukprot:7633890-Prorocentrum_lima.AAC.1